MSVDKRNEELILFCQMLSMASQSGIPLAESLIEASNAHSGRIAGNWCRNLALRLKDGYSIENAMQDLEGFDSILAGIVAVIGEDRLIEILQSYSRFLLFIETIRENLKTAFFYPLVIMFFLLANLMLLNFFVFPALFQEFIGKINEVPILMRALYFAEPRMWPFSLLFPCLFFWATANTVKTIWTGDWQVFRHSLIARLMKLNLFIEKQAEARIQSLIALYLGAGFTLVESIYRASDSDPKMSETFRLRNVAEALKNGVDFKEAMEQSPVLEYFAEVSTEGQELEFKLKKMAKLRFHSAKKDFSFMEKVASIVAVILAGIMVMIISLSFFSTYFWQLWEVIK